MVTFVTEDGATRWSDDGKGEINIELCGHMQVKMQWCFMNQCFEYV